MMRFLIKTVALGATFFAVSALAADCNDDAVAVGSNCLDQFEASVWTIDLAEPEYDKSYEKLSDLARGGHATLAKLNAIAGIQQVGFAADDYGPTCPDHGAGCTNHFALSIAGVKPAAWITHIQALAACRNSGKHMADNRTWTAGALGTPDPGTDDSSTNCNIDSVHAAVDTGSRSACVSDVGAYDMVGNIREHVSDTITRASHCHHVWTFPGNDLQCFVGAATSGEPGALERGGYYSDRTTAGVFSYEGRGTLSGAGAHLGFRCMKWKKH